MSPDECERAAKQQEIMAEMENARWNMSRFSMDESGEKEKDVNRKISPYLISWSELPGEVKEWD